jgi:hypothetical protein
MLVPSSYDELIQKITATGISENEARLAVRRCTFAMAKQGVVGYAGAGAFTYFMAMNPATAVPYLVGGAVLGAGYALAKSPQCSEVRTAIRFWNATPI